MRIESSVLALAAVHVAVDSVAVEERLEVRAGPVAQARPKAAPSQDTVEIMDPNLLLIQWLYAFFTGRRMPMARSANPRPTAAAAAPSPAGNAWGVSYTRREVHQEIEATSFAAEGSVRLESGATIDFSLQLEMNRQLTEINGVAFQAGNMSDPIVVNLDGAGVRLSGERQAFDLNGDGVDEMIATLAAGSAWLARDGNGNGQVDSGGELFGPDSGDGFRELAALDQDRNGWIDEGDAAYDGMGLWSGGAFTSLREAGIGALAVAAVSTPFALKVGSELLGQVRQSGVYLREDGMPGVLQQVDLDITG